MTIVKSIALKKNKLLFCVNKWRKKSYKTIYRIPINLYYENADDSYVRKRTGF
jgi:hypothetical protein